MTDTQERIRERFDAVKYLVGFYGGDAEIDKHLDVIQAHIAEQDKTIRQTILDAAAKDTNHKEQIKIRQDSINGLVHLQRERNKKITVLEKALEIAANSMTYRCPDKDTFNSDSNQHWINHFLAQAEKELEGE